ncbi:MAG: FliM/FliN family flagellar motor switch protein [Halocynthiibacter sp.]
MTVIAQMLAPSVQEAGDPHRRALIADMSLAIARAGMRSIGLSLEVTAHEDQQTMPESLLDELSTSMLLVQLSEPMGGHGLLVLDEVLLGAILSFLTTEDIGEGSSDVRPPTQTDKALCDPFLNLLFSELNKKMAPYPEQSLMSGYKVAGMVRDVQSVPLTLDRSQHQVWSFTLRIGERDMDGNLKLIFPSSPVVRPADAPDFSDCWNANLYKSLAPVEVPLIFSLCEIQTDIRSLQNLEVDQVIDLPMADLENIYLRGADGGLIGKGQLGQNHGKKAVRWQCAADEIDETAESTPMPVDITDPLANATELDKGVHPDAGYEAPPISPDSTLDMPDIDISDIPPNFDAALA